MSDARLGAKPSNATLINVQSGSLGGNTALMSTSGRRAGTEGTRWAQKSSHGESHLDPMTTPWHASKRPTKEAASLLSLSPDLFSRQEPTNQLVPM